MKSDGNAGKGSLGEFAGDVLTEVAWYFIFYQRVARECLFSFRSTSFARGVYEGPNEVT